MSKHTKRQVNELCFPTGVLLPGLRFISYKLPILWIENKKHNSQVLSTSVLCRTQP